MAEYSLADWLIMTNATILVAWYIWKLWRV
jgi:hypothetical protein